jgi:hypothetical protein
MPESPSGSAEPGDAAHVGADGALPQDGVRIHATDEEPASYPNSDRMQFGTAHLPGPGATGAVRPDDSPPADT